MVPGFNSLLCCYSWGADHSAQNWEPKWGDGGYVPWNVHQVPPVPFWKVQDPVWPDRERHPANPVKEEGQVEALDQTSIITTPPSVPFTQLVQTWCPVRVICGHKSIFAKETFILFIVGFENTPLASGIRLDHITPNLTKKFALFLHLPFLSEGIKLDCLGADLH